MKLSTEELLQLDDQFCWHPFTQAKTANKPLPIQGGEGPWLIDTEGNRHFDAVSSWWVNLHGHCNADIARAIAEQAKTLEHVMFAGVTHPTAALYARELIARAPKPMSRVFYSDNGSTAVEVALKMAFQYWHNKAQAGGLNSGKHTLIALEGGYHGDTFGAMAAGRSSGFYDPFKPWLFDVQFIPTGVCEHSEAESLEALELVLTQSDHIAALVLEPLVQGANGMTMMRPEYVAALAKRCKAAGVLVIFDEVMTGFGRTGTLFAAEQVAQFGGHADLICLSKGLTGGFMPMGATLASQAIYEAFLSDQVGHALLHGHSYTANPLGCAAALASLAIFDKAETWQRISALETIHREWLPKLQSHPLIENPRICGTIAAFELKSQAGGYGSATSQWLREAFMAKQIIVRPLGNSLYWIPPYCTTDEQMNNAYRALFEVLAAWEAIGNSPQTGSELF